ncbi:MAG: tRNA (guanine-N(1)-)-methyltransferase [Candidatus Poribacteria bacterium]|nr:MAG: tRNA (guanine-N(1)-)-methyltransferase [Candidatus Poribacteria bacterium]
MEELPLLRCDILTIFPEMVAHAARFGVLRRAQDSGKVSLRAINLRDFAVDRHRTTDDYPYGGGAGMVMKPEPFFRAVRAIAAQAKETPRVILLTPQGRTLRQRDCERLSLERHLVLLCGRYKGVDERVRTALVDEEISVGDYVLSGGELPALILLDAVVRLVPGVLSDAESALGDSFSEELLDAPYFTRPACYEGWEVPETLRSGNPRRIARWRRREALRRTWLRRPDLLERAALGEEDLQLLQEVREEHERALQRSLF